MGYMFPEYLFQDEEHQAFQLNGGDSAALLIHGFPGTPAEMRGIANSLNTIGWSVYGVLLPGLGPNIGKLREQSHVDWINAVADALDSILGEYRVCMICGFSMGAALAIIAAARLRVDGVVLLAPFWDFSNYIWKFMPAIQRILPEIQPFKFLNTDLEMSEFQMGLQKLLPETNLSDPNLQKQLREYSFPTRIINEIRKVGLTAADAASTINQPVLVIQGHQDKVVRPKQTKKLVNMFPVRVIYQEVDGGHDLPDRDKPAWNTIQSSIIDFASSIQAGFHKQTSL